MAALLLTGCVVCASTIKRFSQLEHKEEGKKYEVLLNKKDQPAGPTLPPCMPLPSKCAPKEMS